MGDQRPKGHVRVDACSQVVNAPDAYRTCGLVVQYYFILRVLLCQGLVVYVPWTLAARCRCRVLDKQIKNVTKHVVCWMLLHREWLAR
eukprot:5381888-Pyramimonas_sp.AAC.2